MTDAHSARLGRLLAGWETGSGAVPERLATALADLVAHGDLRSGERLSSERALAGVLSISRGSVTDAYARLKESHWIESRPGSGWFIAPEHARPRGETLVGDARLSSFDARTLVQTDLSSGAPYGLDLVADIAASTIASADFRALVSGDGYSVAGLPALREALAKNYVELGVPTTAEQIVVASGSQQALKLVADTCVFQDDIVLVEDPSYRGALDVFRSRGAKLVPVPIDSDGPDLAALGRLVARLKPRVVYLLPIAHNPTGYVVSESKARQIAALIDDSHAVFVEDGSTLELVFDPAGPPSPVGGYMRSDRWITIGSTSKLFWGGLRTGWIRASESMIHSLTRAKATEDLGSSMISQVVATGCFTRVNEARTLRRMQMIAGLAAAEEALRECAPEWSWQVPAGGSGLWVRLPGTDTTAFSQHARRAGITVVPGPVFSAVNGFQDYLRIPFWRSPDDIQGGVAALADLWQAHRSATTLAHEARATPVGATWS